MLVRLAAVVLLCLLPGRANAQTSSPDDPVNRLSLEQAQPAASADTADMYVPIDAAERVEWVVVGTVGPTSLAVGVLAAGWQSGFNLVPDWNQTWGGFGKRYGERLADVALSNSIEAGLGAFWGEEPRYILSGRQGIWPRARYALKTVLLAQRSDGRLAPAWGRYAGNTLNNVIEDAWLPPKGITWEQTALRSLNGFLGRAASNLWGEFWPDVRKLIKKK
jgi:hypothetical protein